MGTLRSITVILAAGSAAAAAAWRAACKVGRATDAGADRLPALSAAVRKAIHDLNNPLAAAAINAELLCATCPDDANAQRLAKSIQDQIERAKDAVATLNELTRSTES